MNWLKQLVSRHRLYGDLSEEIQEHLEEKVEALVRSGMSRKDAEFAARREFGNVTLTEEGARDVWRWPSLENLLDDVRYGFRMLRNKPGFSLVAIVTLALGIGANTAIFSVVDAALIRPLPYWQPNRLITLSEVRPQEGKSGETDTRNWNASYPEYLDWTRQSKSFESLAGFGSDIFTLHGTEPELIFGAQTTINFFSTLGVKPFLGRDFALGEDLAAGPKVAILSYGSWLRRFGGDKQILGRSLELDNKSVSIIGVLPREFEFAPQGNAEIWVPLHIEKDMASRRSLRWMPVIGRLAPGVPPPDFAAPGGKHDACGGRRRAWPVARRVGHFAPRCGHTENASRRCAFLARRSPEFCGPHVSVCRRDFHRSGLQSRSRPADFSWTRRRGAQRGRTCFRRWNSHAAPRRPGHRGNCLFVGGLDRLSPDGRKPGRARAPQSRV
jgi:MacB-like periplasmic core domain